MKRIFFIVMAIALAVSCGKDSKSESKGKTNGDVVQIPVEAIDLGVECTRGDGTKYKLLWAAYNLCEDGFVSAAEEYGDYYAWGGIVPHYAKGHAKDKPCTSWREIDGKTMTGYNWASYKWCDGRQNAITKYCAASAADYWVGTDPVDGKVELAGYDYTDDTARKALDGKWRIPSSVEWAALRSQCTWEWTTVNGVPGRKVTGISTGNSIFLPAAGLRNADGLDGAGVEGNYWSSSINTLNPNIADSQKIDSGNPRSSQQSRMYGFSIRPVWEAE